jgi:hypothetical protein
MMSETIDESVHTMRHISSLGRYCCALHACQGAFMASADGEQVQHHLVKLNSILNDRKAPRGRTKVR